MTKTFLAVTPLFILLAACGNPQAEAPAAARPIAVNVETTALRQWPSIYEATGTVRARYSAAISAKLTGYIREVKVQAGDRVSAGQLLIVVEASGADAGAKQAAAAREEVSSSIPEADSAVAAAKANLDLVAVTFKRMNELYQKKSISDQEFDQASAKLKAAQAAYEIAQAKRLQLNSKMAQADQELRAAEVLKGDAEIRSPFAGTVVAREVDPGNLATPGAPLLAIEGGGYRMETSVEESRLKAIHLKQPVSVRIEALNGPIEAHVSEITPAVDAASRSSVVKIELPSSAGMRSGAYGSADFVVGSRNVLAVPEEALREHGQLQSVFVAGHGVARLRLVSLGARWDKQVEVLSGLSNGDQVIVPIPNSLSDGARIEVQR